MNPQLKQRVIKAVRYGDADSRDYHNRLAPVNTIVEVDIALDLCTIIASHSRIPFWQCSFTYILSSNDFSL